MMHRGITRRALLAAALAVAVLLALPSLALAIPRDVVLERGKVWVDLNVPYSQSRYATVAGVVLPADSSAPSKGYRTDCSGFVSMCLNLRYDDGRPKSLDTAGLPNVLDVIDKHLLAPGDVVLRPKNPAKNVSGHAVIFVSWVDDTHTKFITYEEGSSKTGTYSRVVDFDALYTSGFRAYRYEAIQDDFADCQQRISGADRYTTAVAASKTAFPGTAPTVVLASGENWPDALGGAALAGAVQGPVLLTARGGLTNVTRAEIARLKPAKVFVLGGTASVSSQVESETAALGATVVRIGGKDRYETSSLIASQTIASARAAGRTVDQVYVANGLNYPDALAAAPVSYKFARPVVLTEPNRLPAAAERAIGSVKPKLVWVLGGTASVDESVTARIDSKWAVKRLAASDRYGTAAAVARHGVALGMSWEQCGLASGAGFADALSGGAALGAMNQVMLLTYPTSLSAETRQQLERSAADIDTMRVFGGMNSVSYPVRQAVADMLRSATATTTP